MGDEKMDRKDRALYEEINRQAAKLSQKWFDTRQKKDGSIYSNDVNESIEKQLKEQHLFTIQTIASGFLPEQELFHENVYQWTKEVVKTRLEWDTPIYEVVAAVNKTRNLIWTFITEYAMEKEEITKKDVLRWSAVYHPILDTLISEFSTQYYRLTRSRLKGQEKLIEEIDSPIIPVSSSIAILPLIGMMDESRAASLFELIPVKCAEKRIVHLVMDLSGIHDIDTFVANQLFQLTKSLQLIGVQTVLSGIRPEVAQTAIQLGLDFSQVKTFHGLPQALAYLGFGQ
ncbi:STAS domain-containing protein [Domibacillus enclensis]|uniref:RsbT co-antagonist protein RsbR n=2 Tax=Domibacillus enclensis TaxID=1017273 RepID=A0A1N6Y7M0_9BACI|nr:STAS domain-containing protein [Domibacillus enclensis]SIR10471.1 rsbT co-antagonist protein RsbR [Domibacillus enclensis]